MAFKYHNLDNEDKAYLVTLLLLVGLGMIFHSLGMITKDSAWNVAGVGINTLQVLHIIYYLTTH